MGSMLCSMSTNRLQVAVENTSVYQNEQVSARFFPP